MVCAPTELQQNAPARAVNELHRAGAPLFYKENAQSGDFTVPRHRWAAGEQRSGCA
mgnify:FL=1